MVAVLVLFELLPLAFVLLPMSIYTLLSLIYIGQYLVLFVGTARSLPVVDLLLCVSNCSDATPIGNVTVDPRPIRMQLGRLDR